MAVRAVAARVAEAAEMEAVRAVEAATAVAHSAEHLVVSVAAPGWTEKEAAVPAAMVAH